MIENEVESTANEVLERYFPKGNEQRGNVLLLYASAILEGENKVKKELAKEKKDLISKHKKEIEDLVSKYNDSVKLLKSRLPRFTLIIDKIFEVKD